MHAWTTARQGLTLSRRAIIAIFVGVVLMFLSPGLGSAVVIAAVLAAGVGSLMFTFGLPESPARGLALNAFFVGLAAAAVQVGAWFAFDPWDSGREPVQLAGKLIGGIALAIHFGAWKSAALANSDQAAASRCDSARVLALVSYAAQALLGGHHASVVLSLLLAVVAIASLVTTWRAMTALEAALGDRNVYDADAIET